MAHILSIALLIIIMVAIRILPVGFNVEKDITTLSLGFLLLTAFIFAKLSVKFKLPRISGYIIAGIIFGPYIVGFFSITSVENINFINHLALAFIAFAAGGELEISMLKKSLKSIMTITFMSILFVFFGVTATVFFLKPMIPFLDGFSNIQILAIAAIFGIISTARSPSSAIAIINETGANGPVAKTVLSVSIVMDVLIIILFSFVVSIADTVLSSDSKLHFTFFLIIILETVLSIIIGLLIGYLISFIIKYLKTDFPIIIILLGIFVTKGSHIFSDYLEVSHDITLHFEPLLVCMAAGFTVANFSGFGKHFLSSMQRISLPIYALFFAIAGASINLNVLKASWLIGIILFFARTLTLYLGISTGAYISKSTEPVKKYGWLGFITQAGVGLGLANEVVRRFPDWGGAVATIIIAVISINQIIGPITFKFALAKGKEIKKS